MHDSPLRICMVAPLPPPYGGISHWSAMMKKYAASQTNIQLEFVDIAPRWRAIHDLSHWKRIIGGLLQTLRDSWRLLVRLIQDRPQIIHLTTSGQLAVFRDLLLMIIAKTFLVPVIYHIRFGRVPDIAERSTREWFLMKLAMRMAHTVIAIDGLTRKAINKYLPLVKIEQIPNCVNFSALPQNNDQSSDISKVVFIGWVIPTKGVEELLAAWSQMHMPGWQLDIVGPGDQNYQKALLEKYQPQNISFHGELSHGAAMNLLSTADCFVLPSYTEGFPNVVLEAMALGKPIVATNVGAIPEMLEGQCGIVVKPQSVKELKIALQTVLENEVLRKSIGVSALSKAHSEYSLEVVFKKYLNVWQEAARKEQRK
ncbi:MAG: glycosyltransferase family 4 protein [Desulfuromonadales bacterium]|nr:glycosyltransferase family 4 protein [Desulfuromonadales bacterium]